MSTVSKMDGSGSITLEDGMEDGPERMLSNVSYYTAAESESLHGSSPPPSLEGSPYRNSSLKPMGSNQSGGISEVEASCLSNTSSASLPSALAKWAWHLTGALALEVDSSESDLSESSRAIRESSFMRKATAKLEQMEKMRQGEGCSSASTLGPNPLAQDTDDFRISSAVAVDQTDSRGPRPLECSGTSDLTAALKRTDTMSLHVMIHEMLRSQVAELLVKKVKVAETLKQLELKEILLLEEVKQAEALMGSEVMDAGIMDDPTITESFEEPAYEGLLEQYRNLLDGYYALKHGVAPEEVLASVSDLQDTTHVPISKVIDLNGRWVKSRGWHLNGSHQGNSSQLYRLLAEEVGELLAELDKNRLDRAAHETGDVLAYCLQFVWEFNLKDRFPPNPKAPTRWIRLDESFAQHQLRKAEELAAKAGSGGRIELRDILLRLHRSLSNLASSLRTMNGDHQRFQDASNSQKKTALAEDLGMILESIIEVTVTYRLGLHRRQDTSWLYSGKRDGQDDGWVQSYQCQNRSCGAQKEVPTRPLCRKCAKANACKGCGDQRELLGGGFKLSSTAMCTTCMEMNECKACKRKGVKQKADHVLCKTCHEANKCGCGEQKQSYGQPLCQKCYKEAQKAARKVAATPMPDLTQAGSPKRRVGPAKATAAQQHTESSGMASKPKPAGRKKGASKGPQGPPPC